MLHVTSIIFSLAAHDIICHATTKSRSAASSRHLSDRPGQQFSQTVGGKSLVSEEMRVQSPPTALPRLGGPAFWPCSTGGRPNTDDSLQVVVARVGHIARSNLGSIDFGGVKPTRGLGSHADKLRHSGCCHSADISHSQCPISRGQMAFQARGLGCRSRHFRTSAITRADEGPDPVYSPSVSATAP